MITLHKIFSFIRKWWKAILGVIALLFAYTLGIHRSAREDSDHPRRDGGGTHQDEERPVGGRQRSEQRSRPRRGGF